MIQSVIAYLVQNPDVKEKIVEGKASLCGLSALEQKAVLEVFQGSISLRSPIQYW